MFDKKCEKCGAPATVQMDLAYLCSKHAFDKVMAAKGPVPRLKPAK